MAVETVPEVAGHLFPFESLPWLGSSGCIIGPYPLAEDDGGDGGVPAWLENERAPSGDLPLTGLAFDQAKYWADNVEVVVGDVISDPTVVQPTGMVLVQAQPVVDVIGVALSPFLQESITVVIEMVAKDAEQSPILISSISDTNEVLYSVISVSVNETDSSAQATDQTRVIETDNFEGLPSKIAMSRTPTFLSISLNGGAVATNGNAGSPVTATHAIFGAQGVNDLIGFDSTIASVFVYTLQPDGDLPAMSG